ncbi:putative late blight resistance protein homolog R1A-10 [Andrographis paniculata]|uniref:putative late blight resistance protein homolog R1A-10 n=1 Tax=Andrographis paniculata TaxID=175694 RepID=UPI0021E8F01D|nr:putative late blight resistance protein homolog R1A-10 [Andrographis paniculata]
MADAAVEFLLENLQKLVVEQTQLIKGARGEIKKLQDDLGIFRSFLVDSSKKRRRDNNYKEELVRRIRDVVYDAEDIIDTFVTQAADTRSKYNIAKYWKKPMNLSDIAKKVASISGEVQTVHNMIKVELQTNRDEGPEVREGPLVRRENVVGFEDAASEIKGYLTEETDRLNIITIIGMPGLGKTTLAGKIFRDETLAYEFPTRIWVYVSQEFSVKSVHLAILREFTRVTDEEASKLDNVKLAELVFNHLKTGKFLIVMDDVWTAENWDKIKVALPMSNNAGKVLITSRHEDVALRANKNRVHRLRFLTSDESWLLLQYEAFGEPDPDCPPGLREVGILISSSCDGLPLAIVVIGGILRKIKVLDDDKIDAWRRVSQKVDAYLHDQDPGKNMEKIIALSYDKLPYHLRACFLYLGLFPEDSKISVWKLIQLWIAEGFIQPKEGISQEEEAGNYLAELINRNLVTVAERKPDGRVKMCGIHDMLRVFCRSEAKKENFLHHMKWTPEGFENPSVEKSRRICIHSNVSNFLYLKPIGTRVRSFVCFSKEDTPLQSEHTSAIPAAFKLLRVLDVKPIKFERIPKDMYDLMHLRYINIAVTNLTSLPPKFENFWNMETLILDTPSRTLEIKADIWKMSKMRHLKTNASAILPNPEGSNKEGKKLHTLDNISPLSCTGKVFDKVPNLKKLGIRGDLTTLLDARNAASFSNLVKLGSLEKLKLLNDVFPKPPSEGKLQRLPSANEFPPQLKSLTLSDTFLDWSCMSILGSLENLKVLKLKEKAVNGQSWTPKKGGFCCLEFLHIGRTELTVWEASHVHFPKLRCLELYNCEKLVAVPPDLANIPDFQELKLHCSTLAAASAIKILENQQQRRGKNTIDGEFKLSIFPPFNVA